MIKLILLMTQYFVLFGCVSTSSVRAPANYADIDIETFRDLCLKAPSLSDDSDDLPRRPQPMKSEFDIIGDRGTPSNLVCQFENVRATEVHRLMYDKRLKDLCPRYGMTNRTGFPPLTKGQTGALQSVQYTHATGALTLWCRLPLT